MTTNKITTGDPFNDVAAAGRWQRVKELLGDILNYHFFDADISWARSDGERTIEAHRLKERIHEFCRFMLRMIEKLDERDEWDRTQGNEHGTDATFWDGHYSQFRFQADYEACWARGLEACIQGFYSAGAKISPTTTHDLNHVSFNRPGVACAFNFVLTRDNTADADEIRRFIEVYKPDCHVSDFLLPAPDGLLEKALVEVDEPTKKLSLSTADKHNDLLSNHADILSNSGGNAMANNIQDLKKLPAELLEQPRFFKVAANKDPLIKAWSKPNNQQLPAQIDGLKGFDTCGHGRSADYMLIDFDHVLDDNGEFVTADAEQWYNFIQSSFEDCFCERSISKHGLHILAKPTPGKFNAISAGKRGTLHFGNGAKLELFYHSAARYCLLTGDLYHCTADAKIPAGVVVDDVFQTLLDEIQKRTAADTDAKKPARGASEIPADNRDYDEYRARIMLDCIVPADLEDSDWLAVISSCKNLGIDYSVVDAWNLRDRERYDEAENQKRWDSATDPSFDIETLHGIAKRFGYSEKDTRREWFKLHPELSILFCRILQNKNRLKQLQNTQHTRAQIDTRSIIRDCPVNLCIPDNFKFGYDGITFIEPPKRENGKSRYIIVTRTPIIPTKIFREPSKNKYSYEVAIFVRGVWHTTEIDGRTLADPRAIIALNDDGAIILEPKLICRFLSDIIAFNAELAEIKAYDRTGWTDETFKTFAYPNNGEHIIRRAGFDFNQTLATRGDADAWKQKFIEVVDKGGAIAHMYIGTALGAILARPLNLPNPQTHLHGTSGGGKTALQKFTASIFGNPRKLMRTFAATNKNRQLVAAAFCDLPNFYDELETVQSKAAEETLANDIYNFADGKGNQANNRNGNARETFEFGGARLMTGERPILKQHDMRGAYKRLIQLDIRNSVFDDDFAAELHIFSEANFGHFGKLWIQFVTEHLQEIQAQFQREASRRDPTTKPYEPTHLKTVAACLVAFGFFKVMIGIDTEFDRFSFIRDWRIIVDALPTVAEMDDTERAIEFLQSFVAGNGKSFAREVDNPNFNNEFSQQAQTCHGKKFKNGEVAFFPHAFTAILEKEGGFKSADKLRNEFYAKGYLKHNAGRYTYQTWFDGKPERMIRFLPNVISTAESCTCENTADEV